jgi:DNA-binding transcriptional regulator YiaG
MQPTQRKMQAMRATLNKLRKLAGKWLAPARPLALQAQPDITHALPITNLRERLTSLAITQSQFAELCQVHPNTVSNWANGRTRMSGAAEPVLQVLEADKQAAQYVVLASARRAVHAASRSRRAIPIGSVTSVARFTSLARSMHGSLHSPLPSSKASN